MLSPFKNHRQEETIEIGAPTLRPEISSILELLFSKSWKKVDFTVTGYYNKINDKVFRVNEIYTRTIAPLQQDWSCQQVFNFTYWWRINVTGNVYDYRINGMFKGNAVNQISTNYNGNASTTIDFSKRLKFQWGFAYTSNTVTSQGHDTHLFLSTAGGRYSIWNKRGYISLQLNNIINTNAQTIITQGSDFYSSTEYIKYDRALQVSFGWQLNNNTKKKKSAKTDYGEKEF